LDGYRILDVIQKSCSMHNIGHGGVKTLLVGMFKFGLEVTLGLLLVLPRFLPVSFMLVILFPFCLALYDIFVTSISREIIC